MDVFQLAPNHVWKATPGCRILIVDNGGLRCDIPYDWIVYSPRTHVFAVDRFPPDNRCLMAISCRRVSSQVMAIPLRQILEEWVTGEDRYVADRKEPVYFVRWPLQAAWIQLELTGGEPARDRITRICVARADRTQALIILDFLSVDEPFVEKAWETLMDTLVIGDYIADPLTGRRRMQRG
jgi:hypothetical protein